MYEISPEFEKLKKIPIVTRPIQVRLTQLYFSGLMKKEAAKWPGCKRIHIPSSFSSRGRLSCLCYTPEGCTEKSPALLYFHGGAFVFPALPYHLRIARHFSAELNCRVFLPDYDLAPYAVPPVQQNEAQEIYQYFIDNSESFGIDTARVAIGGDSAGGTMCAALCLRLKREGMAMPAAQMLLYPSLDARLQSDSMKKYTDVPICNSRAVKAYYKICEPYPDKLPSLEDRSPAEAPSLEGMPPTYVETAEFDCLHDDGIVYAKRLEEAGCDVILNETKGTVHAYDLARKSSILKESLTKRTGFLRDHLG